MYMGEGRYLCMDDSQIVQLYLDKDETAISESGRKYGPYCNSIARNILENWADAEECVNETWLRAWNAIPPHKPAVLSAFFGKITRNLAFDRYRSRTREKRGGHMVELALDELAECVSGEDDPEKNWKEQQLREDLRRFVGQLPAKKRYMFIQRYWYTESIGNIAERYGVSENSVSVTLNRIRKQLKEYLIERGYDI